MFVASVLLGCGPAAPAASNLATSPTETSGAVPSATEPGEAVDPVQAMAVGAWRAIPVDVSRAFSAPFEAGCRAAEPGLAGLFAALVDVRGANAVDIVFVRDREAYLCRARVDAPATPEAITKLAVAAAALPEDGIDVALYTLVGNGDSARTILVGRVGTAAAHVIAGFDDESYIFGAQSGGWYAMWWPGTALMAAVSSTDKAHIVLTAAHATRQ